MKLMEGVITPIVTPFNYDKNQTVNNIELKRLIDYLIGHGINGIFALGTNGEFHVMEYKEKIDFVSSVIEATNNRVPVYGNVGSCSLKESISLATEMEKLGVHAITSVAPYFVQLNDDEMYDFFYEIATSVNIPLIVYNIPKFTGYNISPLLVKRLVGANIGVKGIKDSSGDMELFEKYAEISKDYDFKVMVGSDSKITSAFHLGATACVAGTSNLITDTIVSLWNALEKEDGISKKLQNDIEVLRKTLALGTQPSVIKKGIELSSIALVGAARKPIQEPDENISIQINEMLQYFDLI
ncbi:dihydrodipicolinate synthase family protein [Salmonella enterica]|uniref:dihydrodipicolinate synthase family protein n=1 Tax=Salmonella enterica TaxID=28901 RepID=UPI0028EABF23|nr:dihydrodipicolinate synthase family protein [Salmonella enterica]